MNDEERVALVRAGLEAAKSACQTARELGLAPEYEIDRLDPTAIAATVPTSVTEEGLEYSLRSCERELAALRRDAERLDFMEQHKSCPWWNFSKWMMNIGEGRRITAKGEGATLREAIDCTQRQAESAASSSAS